MKNTWTKKGNEHYLTITFSKKDLAKINKDPLYKNEDTETKLRKWAYEHMTEWGGPYRFATKGNKLHVYQGVFGKKQMAKKVMI